VHSIAGEPMLDGRYQLERRLGHGGMGVVFQARHIFLKTAHAIKVILPDLVGNDPMLVTRFRQEALAAAAIRHQNIIAVTDFGVARGTMPFLVMEFVKGKSLHDILAAEGPLSPARALEIISAVGSGVAAAHRQNIVHRDLKPLNIMLQDGMPISEAIKVLDFGLAKIKSGELLGSFVQAKTSGLMGSPFYMAPEQWSDEEPDVRADIYSLGVILYQMLGGDVPFKGTGIPSIMKKHLTAAPPTLSSMGVNVPPQVEAVVRHALEKDADNRPQTVEAFIAELRDAVANTSASLDRTYVGPGISSETIITPSQGRISRPPQAPAETTLKVHTTPSYSRVYIDNVSVGKSDGTGEIVIQEIHKGTHRVRVVHDGYAEWERQIECDGGECLVDAELQSLMQTSLPQMSGDQLAGTITGASDQMPASIHSIEAQRLRAQAAALEERARLEEAERVERERREQERREMEERDRIAREELAREEEARRQAEAERQRVEAEERQKAEAAALERKRLETERERAEEATRLRAEAEAARRQAEAEAQERKRLEEERKAAEAEARQRSEEEKRQRAEEEAARRKAEEAAAAQRAEEEKRLRAEAEAARKRAEEESTARKAAEEEAARLRAEQQTHKKAEAENALKRAEEERLRAETEAARAEEAKRLRAEAEAARKQAEAEAQERKRLEEERRRVEAEAQRRIEEERRRAEAERQRLEKERYAREEKERAALMAERERLARELKEREEQMARMAATSLAPGMDETQQQRRAVVTQQMGEQSLADATAANSWQQQPSQPGLHQSVGAPPYAPAAQKKSALPMILIAAVLAVVVIGGGAGAYFMLGSKTTSTDQPQVKNDPNKPGGGSNNSDTKNTRAEMISIPGGAFQMGRNDGSAQEAPMHSVTVSDFSMDKTEVTNAEYAEFVNEAKRTPPSHWPGGKVLSGQEHWPVNNVSIDDAKAFASWRSKRDGVTYRLPTEEEWEYAARGGEQDNLYPWGNTWANDSAVVKMVSPQAVGSFPGGKNRWGVVDLIGNVWEWTSSKASIYPGNGRLSVPDQDKDSYVMRGGSYASEPSGERAITATFRDWVPASTKHPTLGFRLVRAGS
jgi:formylglycine-generating enzyme required for sulfatase activity/serine/threonine protein kinase